jgi:high-affinity K+ transport system ATPase subunit B
VFSLLFTPIGRYAAIAMLVIGLTSCVIYKIRKDAVAEVEAKATADALRRTENAIRSGDSVDLSTGGLRQPDKFQRND